MPYVENFTATQIVGFNNKVVLTDTSTGTDAGIVSRIAYFQKPDGSYLVPARTTTDYVVWALADVSITVAILSKDYALLITVKWLDVDGNALYTKELRRGFTQYNESFDYGLTQRMSGNPLLINDNNFYKNKSDLRTDIDSGDQALSEASDLYGAQQSYDRATKLRIASPYSFNANS